MRNYLKASVRMCGFTVVFTGQPCIGISLGMDDDDSRMLAQKQLAYMKAEIPGGDFSGDYITDPMYFYLELDRQILFRAMHNDFGAGILQGLVNQPSFRLFDYDQHVNDVVFIDFVTDKSPKKSWSNGK